MEGTIQILVPLESQMCYMGGLYIYLLMLYSIDSGGVFTTEIRSDSDYTEGLWHNSLLMIKKIWGMGKTITFGTGA